MQALDALGNPVRRAILEQLRDGPRPVGELAAGFDVSRPAISRHLKVLQGAGLIDRTTRGRQNLYALDPSGFTAVEAYLHSFWDEAIVRLKLVAENLEES